MLQDAFPVLCDRPQKWVPLLTYKNATCVTLWKVRKALQDGVFNGLPEWDMWFRTLWTVESLVGTCFVELHAIILFFLLLHMIRVPLLRTQLCLFIQFNKSFCSNWISISLLFTWFSPGFSLSHVRGLSLPLHYGAHVALCALCLQWHHFRLSPITSIIILMGIYRKDLPLLFHLSWDSHSAE